jgi:hypothetical protein
MTQIVTSGEKIDISGRKIVSLIARPNLAMGVATWSVRITNESTGEVLFENSAISVAQVSLRRHPIVEAHLIVELGGVDSICLVLERYVAR